MKCDHDLPKVEEQLKQMSLPKSLREELMDHHKNGVCLEKPILMADLMKKLTKFHQEMLRRVGKMTKEKALERVFQLVKEGMQWHDQFQGHGHWEFHLSNEEFDELFEVTKVADGKKNA